MAKKSLPTGLLILAFFIVFGVFLGNQWITSEIEEAGQLPPTAVPAVSTAAPQTKDVQSGGQDLVRSVSRIEEKKAQIEPPDPEKEQKITQRKKIIYEKPLDTKHLVQ